MGMSDQITSWDPEDRTAYMLSQSYERIRKEIQSGYSCFPKWLEDLRTSSLFKQFRTVGVWLRSLGWDVRWVNLYWQGYVKYVFKRLHPTIPQPGQLKNNKLIREYLASGDLPVPEGRSQEDMIRLYMSVLPANLRSEKTLHMLGLQNANTNRTSG